MRAQTPNLLKQLALMALVPILLMLSGCVPIPAVLPDKDVVARNTVTPVDGVWRINTLGKRVRIEAGRVYAVDPWLHLGTMQIQPGMVVIQNFQRAGTAHFVGDDLPLQGRFDGYLRPHGRIEVTVLGALGPARYELQPVDLDNATAYKAELAGADQPITDPTPTPLPTPMPIVRPTPRPIPSPGKDVTPGCGGFGEQPCKKVKPSAHGKARNIGCPGKQNYFSSVRGGSCWVCPDGFKRTLRKLDDAKACIKRGVLVGGPWAKAKYNGSAWGCPRGQFNGAGVCMSCPENYERDGIGALSTNFCKPVKGSFGCDAGLRPAKQPPKLKTLLANLFGLKSGKACAPPFDIQAAARAALPSGNQLKAAAEGFLKDMTSSKETMRKFRSAYLRRDWHAMAQLLMAQPGFVRAVKVARDLGYEDMSVGVGGDASILGGLNGEVGLVTNTRTGKLRPYVAGGLSKGASVGIDGTASIGFWKVPFETGGTQGIVSSVSGVISLGGGAWYTYFDPKTRAQEELAGFTFSAGLGLGVEYGEYNEVGTKVYGPVPITLPVM